MHRSTARWTTAIATAALLALPVAGAAQTTGTTPQQPPTTTPQPQPQPQDPTPPSPTPTQQPPATASQPPAAGGQVDANAAKKHLSDARESLAQITSMPEAAKLQGDARTQVSQLISNFNELITTQAEWRASYAKVDANLTTLIGPESTDPTATATTPVGTSGSGVADLDPAIRTKLAEFRSHLNLFEKAAGGPGAAAETPAAASGTMAPTPATGSTTSPANPATPANPDPTSPNPASPTQPPSSAGATGTSGVTPSSPTGSMAPADQAKAASDVNQAAVREHLDAISDILNKSKTGALTKAQTTELKKHVDQLRTLIKQ